MKWICTVALLLAGAVFAADAPLSAADQVAQMKRGVNIVGYDPLWQDPAKGRFKPRHFKIIKEGGFDTVRINLYGFRHMNEKLELAPTWFATLDGLVDEAVKQNLNVILDEHDYERCHEDTARCRRLVLAFWSQVAEHYRNAPQNVVFEILNEPNRAMNDVWNALHARGAGGDPQVQSHAQRDHRSGVLEQHVAGCRSSNCPLTTGTSSSPCTTTSRTSSRTRARAGRRSTPDCRASAGAARGSRENRPGFRRRPGLGEAARPPHPVG